MSALTITVCQPPVQPRRRVGDVGRRVGTFREALNNRPHARYPWHVFTGSVRCAATASATASPAPEEGALQPTEALSPHAALLVHSLLSIIAVAAVLVAAAFVRERHADTRPDNVYESGIVPARAANRPFNARYFLIAAFFVVFDMEAAVLFGWAIAARESGMTGLIEAAIFIIVLLAALAWLWLDGALEWEYGGGRPTR